MGNMNTMEKFLFCLCLFFAGFLSAIGLFENKDSRITKIKSEKALCEKDLKRTEYCEFESVKFRIVNNNEGDSDE